MADAMASPSEHDANSTKQMAAGVNEIVESQDYVLEVPELDGVTIAPGHRVVLEVRFPGGNAWNITDFIRSYLLTKACYAEHRQYPAPAARRHGNFRRSP